LAIRSDAGSWFGRDSKRAFEPRIIAMQRACAIGQSILQPLLTRETVRHRLVGSENSNAPLLLRDEHFASLDQFICAFEINCVGLTNIPGADAHMSARSGVDPVPRFGSQRARISLAAKCCSTAEECSRPIPLVFAFQCSEMRLHERQRLEQNSEKALRGHCVMTIVLELFNARALLGNEPFAELVRYSFVAGIRPDAKGKARKCNDQVSSGDFPVGGWVPSRRMRHQAGSSRWGRLQRPCQSRTL
jgi:hypothetical protein